MRFLERNEYVIFPDRVTRESDGSYRWAGRLEKAYERRDFRITLFSCAGISLLIMLITALTDLKSLWITGPCAAVIMGIAGVICLLLDRAKESSLQQYEMTEKYIRLVNGQACGYYEYPKISRISVGDGYLEVSRNNSCGRLYVPQQDMAFVTEYITSRCEACEEKDGADPGLNEGF